MESPFWHYNSSFDPVELMEKYAVRNPEPDPAHLTNFLGVKISPRFFPRILKGREGQVEPIPIPANWHADIAEWGAVLRSVNAANNLFRVAELGCGWGCWLNNSGAAARSRGLSVKMTGVEGDPGHAQFAEESLRTNGFAPSDFRIIHGIAGPKSGTALFPVVEAGASWGVEPIFDADKQQILSAVATSSHHVLSMIPLSDLTEGEILDLLHIDIQGGELPYIRENIDGLSRSVKRIVIGTHSRQIEGSLMEILIADGWQLEIERPAIINVKFASPKTITDGIQGWFNPRV